MTQTMAGVPLQLADLAMRALTLAAVAGIALEVFRVRTTWLRLLAWKGVLYTALAMPVLAWLLPPVAVPVPSFFQRQANELSPRPQESAHAVATRFVTSVRTNESAVYKESAQTLTQRTTAKRAVDLPPVETSAPSPATAQDFSISWSALVSAVYFAVALLLAARVVVGLILSRRLLRRSTQIWDSSALARLAALARSSGLAFAPQAMESAIISVPVTIGIFRSKIVLPADWRKWDTAKLDAVLAHELSHVSRRDPLTQLLSLLHRAVFWFSPLSWWLDRQLADLAEQASDEAALACGANRNDYARTLLGFLEALHTAPGRVWWQGVSMAKAGQAEKRLERILAWKGMVTMSLKKSVIIALFAIAVPAVYVTAAVHATNPQDVQTPPSPARPSSVPAASGVPAPTPMADASPTAPAIAPVPPIASRNGRTAVVAPAAVPPMYPPAPANAPASIAAVAPPAPSAAWQNHSYGYGRSYSAKGYSYAFSNDDEERFVIVSGNSDSMTMSGDSEDIHHVQRLKKQISGDFIWFSRDEKPYIIRDQATVARARAFWAPQEEIGKKQEELGKQQEELGRQQEALGKKQEEVRVKVPDMTAELDALKAKLQKLGPTATVDQLGDLQSEIGELQSKLGEIQSAAGDEQGKLGEEQGALGEKQGKLGEEQGKLGEEQARLAQKANRQMKELLDESIKNGKAQPEPQSGDGTGTL